MDICEQNCKIYYGDKPVDKILNVCVLLFESLLIKILSVSSFFVCVIIIFAWSVERKETIEETEFLVS